jgi:hypothetical protein
MTLGLLTAASMVLVVHDIEGLSPGSRGQAQMTPRVMVPEAMVPETENVRGIFSRSLRLNTRDSWAVGPAATVF